MSNLNYERHGDNNEDVIQPLSTPGTVDPGDGWETKPYLNFNGEYRKHDDNCIALPPGEQPALNGGDYERRTYDNQIGIVSSYVRN